MGKITLNNGQSFDMEFGGPVSITAGIVFLVKIIKSDPDSVHNAFKDSENIGRILINLNESNTSEEFNGYTAYKGFSIEDDGGIIVTLKKQL